jgi:hypothetical protein
MSDLDLDALEREINAPDSTGMLWKDVGLALIKRVRKAEDIIMPFVQAVETSKDVRLRNLERVKEAAKVLLGYTEDYSGGSSVWRELDAAIADLEEKS